MLAAASRYVLRPRPSQQHIAERSSTDLERPWHVETTYRQCAVNQLELELEADRLVEPLRAEAETAIAKLQSDASARVKRCLPLGQRFAPHVDALVIDHG